MGVPLQQELKRRPNSHLAATGEFEATTGLGWHEPSPASAVGHVRGQPVSVVIPAHDNGYSLRAVLDALADQEHPDDFEVIVVDDGSADDTPGIAADHRVVDCAVRLPRAHGAAAARNTGTALATGDVVVYLDADMVLPVHAISDVALRATDGLVLVGFRHNVAHAVHRGGTELPAGGPQLQADHRVTWRPPADIVLPYSGIVLEEPLETSPLDETRDLLDLGHGRWFYDWDLPRMVVSALVAAPRATVVDVGGFEAEFGRLGWGVDDTYFGACLIAAGLLVVPLRQLVGFHLDPPDADAQWQIKLASWPRTLGLYRRLLQEPPRRSRAAAFAAETRALLHDCVVLR